MNIYDISQKAGVSIATVSRVLNNSPHVSGATRSRVMAVIDENGYVPNAFARGLGLNSMKTVGLLCSNAADPYMAKALSYLELALRHNNYNCLLSCTGRELAGRVKGVELLSSKHVDGMILVGSTFVECTDQENDYIRKAAEQIPVIVMNAALSCTNVYCVLCDEKQSSFEATRYLLDTGRKRILYLYHSKNFNGQKKITGYRDAHMSRGVAVDERLIRFFEEDGMDAREVANTLMVFHQEGLQFDAVYTSEDMLAIGAVKYAHAAGLSIPLDLSVIGHNNSSYSLCTDPELTSVDNKLKAVSNQCVVTLLGLLDGKDMPQKIVFTPELIKRGSTL